MYIYSSWLKITTDKPVADFHHQVIKRAEHTMEKAVTQRWGADFYSFLPNFHAFILRHIHAVACLYIKGFIKFLAVYNGAVYTQLFIAV